VIRQFRLVLFCGALLAVITSPVWSQTTHPETFDHSGFDALLKEVVEDGMVDYAKLAQSQNYQVLQSYLSRLASAPFRKLPQKEQIAMAINAYNANCIHGVLKEGKIKSVRDVWFFFKNTKFHLGGEEMDLDSLEHVVLRNMNEPRFHFAIVNASKSCPKLASQAYRGETLDSDLDRAARDFILDPARNFLDRDKKVLSLSPIFKWFRKDFTVEAPSIKAYVLPFFTEEDQAFIKEPAIKVKFLEYNWDLNGHF
jgi:hypothetical protein